MGFFLHLLKQKSSLFRIIQLFSKVPTFFDILLPPANEVWGKVIFSLACVKNSFHGGGAWSQGGWVPGPRGSLVLGEGVPGPVWVYFWGVWSPSPWMATAAGSMHPTGMHSCELGFELN